VRDAGQVKEGTLGCRRFLEETLDAGIDFLAGFALEAVRGDDVVEAGRRGNVWVS